MIHFFIYRWKIASLLMACFMSFPTITYANTTSPLLPNYTQSSIDSSQIPTYPKYGEWRYNSQVNPPTLIWWNERMDMVPVLYISFLPDRIILDAVTPVWPDTGIILYIKDQSDKIAVNLTLQDRNNKNCIYRATIYEAERQNFLNDLVTSRKARLITPSSYSQSLSLKHVYQAMHDMLSLHPNLHLTLPEPTKYSR